MTVAGHDARLTQSNTGSWLVLCACGWVSNVYPVPKLMERRDGRQLASPRRRPDVARDAALANHAEHVRDVSWAISVAAHDAKPLMTDLAFRMRHTGNR